MIITEITNGLGNQLFQYATAFALAKKKGTDLLIDKSWYETEAASKNNRKFALDKFNINLKFAKLSETTKLKSPKFPFLINSLYWRRQYALPYYKRDFFREQSCLYDSHIFKAKNNVFLSGFFQSEKYFNEFRPILLHDLELNEKPDVDDAHMLKSIQNSNSVCLSIRRGDYLKKENMVAFNIIGFDYYQKAIAYINERVESPVYYIFTDDTEWLNKNIDRFEIRNYIIAGSHLDTPHIGITLMKHCKHYITANSTYSWWGAWLNNDSDSIKITPEKWFLIERLNTIDLIPKGWIQL